MNIVNVTPLMPTFRDILCTTFRLSLDCETVEEAARIACENHGWPTTNAEALDCVVHVVQSFYVLNTSTDVKFWAGEFFGLVLAE